MTTGSSSLKRVTCKRSMREDGTSSMLLKIVTRRSNGNKVNVDRIAQRKEKKQENWEVMRGRACAWLREACHFVGTYKEDIWYYTLTYATPCHSPRVAQKDLERLRDWVEANSVNGKMLGVFELHQREKGQLGGGLHLHVLSNVELPEGVWTKGYAHSRRRKYSASNAYDYLSKQWRERREHNVVFRGQDRVVANRWEYSKLWGRLPYGVASVALQDHLRGGDCVEITDAEARVGKGELYTVALEDWKCVPPHKLSTVSAVSRFKKLKIERMANGTLYASNNSSRPGAIVSWMLQKRKQVLLDTWERARADLAQSYLQQIQTLGSGPLASHFLDRETFENGLFVWDGRESVCVRKLRGIVGYDASSRYFNVA